MADKLYLPFESYIFSTYIQEYNRDVRRKNYVIKYINLLSIDSLDAVSLNKLTQNLIFFRNTFAKDAFLFFINDYFTAVEKEVIGVVIYDMFVKDKEGEIGEYKKFYEEAVKLYKYVNYRHEITEIWEKLKPQNRNKTY